MKHFPAIALLILVVCSIALVVMPSYLVSPLRSQTVDDLELSYNLTRWAPTLVLINLVVGVIFALMIWSRQDAKLRNRVATVIAVVFIIAYTMLASVRSDVPSVRWKRGSGCALESQWCRWFQ